jgi:Domain of unknown function (DUF4270)
MKKLTKIANISALAAMALSATCLFNSCEKEADNLGEQFLNPTSADASKKSFELLAYQADNKDSLRSDATVMTEAYLGAFDEPVFGMQKSDFVTQIRPAVFAPNFGTTPVLDSVVLELQPTYDKNLITSRTENVYKAGSTTDIEAVKTIKTVPVTKYGKNQSLKINVHEVSNFLQAKDTKYTSEAAKNASITNLGLLGSKTFAGNVYEVSSVSTGATAANLLSTAMLRVPLDKNFFQTKIINKTGAPELSDAASFIRYIKGIRLSVEEKDGYLLRFNPNNSAIKLYYKNDVTTNNVTTKTAQTFALNLGGNNAHMALHNFDRRQATVYNQNLANITPATGQKRLYLQGCGGAGAMLSLSPADKQALLDLKGAAVLSAKIKLTTDETFASLPKPASFQILMEASANKFSLIKNTTLLAFSQRPLVMARDLALPKTVYEIDITDDIKQIVENKSTDNAAKLAEIKNFKINIGAFLHEINMNKDPRLANAQATTASFDPSRLVLIGTEAGNPNAAKLEIILSQK